jgi:hypothetical protein
MPPPGYNPEARYLRATRQMPESIGINAINRPQSVELDQYEAEGSEEESEDVDDLDHFLIDPQEQPENDMWLMKWVRGQFSEDMIYFYHFFNLL